MSGDKLQAELTRSRDDSPIRLVSSRFGDIKIPYDFIWSFPEGLIGFRDFTRFALINTQQRDSMFMWLHSTEKGDFAVPVMNPLVVFSDYIIRQDEPDIMRLEIDDAGDVQVLVIVRVPQGDPGGITANLAAPLILIPERKVGYQVVLEKGPYSVSQPLFGDKNADNDDDENLVSVGSHSPAISVLNESFDDDDGDKNIVNRTRIRVQEVMPPPDSVS